MTVRLTHLVSHPIQYFAPLYRELAQRQEIKLTVYFYSDATASTFHDPGFDRTMCWDADLLDGYNWQILRTARDTPLPRGFRKRPHLEIVRAALRSDVVWAHGYSHLAPWLTAGGAAARGVPFMIREEANLLTPRPVWKQAIKYVPLRTLFAAAYGLFIESQNRDYLRRYGISEERLFSSPYAVDNDFFASKAQGLASRKAELRASFGLDQDKPVVLFAGKLVPHKQPALLVDAVTRIKSRQPVQLLVVGDGAQRDDFVGRDGIRLSEFLNQSRLPEAYAVADVFVLPSAYEPWGLVVNEALNFGLPVIVTDRVGCAPDLVRDYWNGRVVAHNDVEALAEALSWVLADGDRRCRLGERGRRLVLGHGIDRAANGIVEAAQAAVRSKIPALNAAKVM